MNERRRDDRTVLRMNAVLSLDNKKLGVMVVDVSKKGMKILIQDENGSIDQKIETFSLKNIEIENVNIKHLEIVWSSKKNNGMTIGVQILNIEPEEEEKLCALVAIRVKDNKVLDTSDNRILHLQDPSSE